MNIQEIETALALLGISHDQDRVLKSLNGWFVIVLRNTNVTAVDLHKRQNQTWPPALGVCDSEKSRLASLAWAWEIVNGKSTEYETPPIDIKVIMGDEWLPVISVIKTIDGHTNFSSMVYEDGKLRYLKADDREPIELRKIHPLFWPEIEALYREAKQCALMK